MKKTPLALLAALGIGSLLIACTPTPPSEPTSEEPTPEITDDADVMDDDRPARVTRNVFYEGTVTPAGISIYMEGSHKLMLDDEKFILLESNSLDLNGYVGERVEVFGSVRPTVEAGAMIMVVDRISLKEEPEPVPEEPEAEEPEEPETEEEQEVPPEEEEAPEEPEPETPEEETVEPTTEPEVTENGFTARQQAMAEQMGKENIDPVRWTQQYCTEHIGFCIPIHKNWWFRSFGNTSSKLWHVEISAAEVENLGDGPLSVDLVSGTIDDLGVSDGSVSIVGDSAVGYRSWIGNEHIEVRAPSVLEESVRYITENLQETPNE